jgi:hypothetical protein
MTDGARWPHGETVTLYGGPMDGEQMVYDAGDLDADPAEWGGYYMVPPEKAAVAPDLPEGTELRAAYEPELGEDPTRWVFSGWVPW